MTTETAATRSSPENRERIDRNSLCEMLSVAKSSDDVSGVLYRLTREGKKFYKSDLVGCIKILRKFRRYEHCLKILEWMEKGTMNCSQRDHALRLGMICNLKGVDEAEKYFDGLPPDLKSQSTYGALLNCYCSEKMSDKALSLFEKMDEMNFTSNVLAFSNLMGLFMKLDQPEKVPPLVLEMKKRNIPLNNRAYNIWVQSYGRLKDLEGVERVVHEVQEQNDMNNDWTIYSNLAVVYMKVGQSEKAEAALKKLEEVVDNLHNPNRDAYNYLISLCATTGNQEFLTRVWDKFNSIFKDCNNHSYLAMVSALSKLDDIEGLKKCFKEWESRYQSYDVRLPTVVIGAYLKQDMVEEAELLLRDAIDRCGRELWNARVTLANYYLGKHQIDSALKHIEWAADNMGKKLPLHVVTSFFKYFKEEKDVDGAEKFYRILKKAERLDFKAYLWLLQIYAASGKKAPEMRQRMEKDGVDIGTEHQKLLQKVCTD